MANNNVQNVKFLRNGSVFTPTGETTARAIALSAMNGQLDNLADGTAILGRYNEGTDGSTVKTLVGFAYISGNAKTLTVFDVDGAGADVDAKILAAIQALDAEKTSADGKNVQVKVTEVDGKITAVNVTTDNTVNSGDVNTAITNAINDLDGSVIAETGFYVKSVTEADGKISGTTEALPTVAAISEAGKPITAVSESLGAISATAGTINAEYVDVSYGAITATNVKGALAEIADEIDAMDKAASAVDGQVVTTVSEADGKVSETKANVKDLQLGGYSKDTSATGDIASTDTINTALSKLENKAAAITIGNTDHSINVTTGASGTDIAVNIKNNEKVVLLGDDGIYTELDLVKITTGLPETVKERYQLLASDDSQIGANIDIPKDSHIVSINYITTGEHAQNLEYVYIDASGETQTTYVDMSELIIEAEVENGIQSINHKLSIKLDTAGDDTGDGKFLTVGANGLKLDGVTDAITAAVNALDVTGDTAQSGKYITHINEENGLISIGGRADISKAPLNDYVKGTAATAVADTDTVNQAISKLENQVDAAKSAATTVVAEGTDAGNNMSIVETAGADGHKIFTVNLSDVASAQGLANEIAYRKAVDGVNGDAYTADTNAHYISGASSLYGADQALDNALNTVDNAMLTGVTAGNGITVLDKANKSQAISAKVNGDNGILNDASGLHLGTIDCGTY